MILSQFQHLKICTKKRKKERFRIQPIGINYLTKIEALELLFENYKINESQIEVQKFLDELFHQNINCKKDEFKYKLSIAVAKIYFTDGIGHNNEIIETHGLLYPSIIRNKESYCFVLKPEVVQDNFFIDYIQTWQVLEKIPNMLKIKLVRHGKLKHEKIYPKDLFDICWENAKKEDIKILNY